MQKTISAFTIIFVSTTLFNTLPIHSMENKKIGLTESGFFESHTSSQVPVSVLSVTLAHHALEKHRKLINEGSNGDLLTHLKEYSPRYQNNYSSSVYNNPHAKTEAELLINPIYHETRNEVPSEPAPINDENGLLY